MVVYQVIQHNEWCCPGMLVFVDDNGNIFANQTNPENGLTYQSKEDHEDWGKFDPADYKEVKEVKL